MEEGESEEEFLPSVRLGARHEKVSFRLCLLDLIEDSHERGLKTFRGLRRDFDIVLQD